MKKFPHQQIFAHNSTHELILASESPRRKELLEKAQFRFTVFPIKVSEKLRKNLNVDNQILSISEEKSIAAQESLSSYGKRPLNEQ